MNIGFSRKKDNDPFDREFARGFYKCDVLVKPGFGYELHIHSNILNNNVKEILMIDELAAYIIPIDSFEHVLEQNNKKDALDALRKLTYPN